MNKLFALTTAALVATTGSAFAGDIAAGEKDFKRCKSCHMIVDGDNVIFKGGKTGPNLYGVIGRTAGALEGFRFGADIIAAGEAGLVWDEETLVAYVMDPKEFLSDTLGDAAKSKMTFKMKDPADVVAYLASVSPVMAAEEDAAAATEDAPAEAMEETAEEKPSE